MPAPENKTDSVELREDKASQHGSPTKVRSRNNSRGSHQETSTEKCHDQLEDQLADIINGSLKLQDEKLSQSKTSLSKTSGSQGFPAQNVPLDDLPLDTSADNGFHSVPKTVILPLVTGANRSPQSLTPQSIRRKFTVTKVQQPSVHTSHSSVAHGPDHGPEVHFKLPRTSMRKSEHHPKEFHRLDTQISEESTPNSK